MALEEKRDVFGNHTSTRHKSVHGETHGYFEDISQPDMLGKGNNYTFKTSDSSGEYKDPYKTTYVKTCPAHEKEIPEHLKDTDFVGGWKRRLVLDGAKEPTKGYKESDGKLEYELDWDFITMMAERMAVNKSKYGKENWKLPIDVDSLKQSLFRHTIEIMKGNYDDVEEGDLGHLTAIALNALFINYQLKNYKEDETD